MVVPIPAFLNFWRRGHARAEGAGVRLWGRLISSVVWGLEMIIMIPAPAECCWTTPNGNLPPQHVLVICW